MKSNYLILLTFILLTGCKPVELGPAPVDVDKMALVLTELQLAEAIKSEVPAALRDSMQRVYEDNVLADHDLTRESFDSLMWIVRQEPEWVVEVYTKISDEIAKITAEGKRVPEEVKEKN